MTVTWYVSLIITTAYGSVATVYRDNRASCSETLSLFVLNIRRVPPDRSHQNIIHLAAVWTVRLIKKSWIWPVTICVWGHTRTSPLLHDCKALRMALSSPFAALLSSFAPDSSCSRDTAHIERQMEEPWGRNRETFRGRQQLCASFSQKRPHGKRVS